MCLAFNPQPPHHNLVLLTLGHEYITPFSFCLSLSAKQQRLPGMLCRSPSLTCFDHVHQTTFTDAMSFSQSDIRPAVCQSIMPFSDDLHSCFNFFTAPLPPGPLHHRHINVSKVRTLSSLFSSKDSSCPKEHAVEKIPLSQEKKKKHLSTSVKALTHQKHISVQIILTITDN